jgi:hypothetical protein
MVHEPGMRMSTGTLFSLAADSRRQISIIVLDLDFDAENFVWEEETRERDAAKLAEMRNQTNQGESFVVQNVSSHSELVGRRSGASMAS